MWPLWRSGKQKAIRNVIFKFATCQVCGTNSKEKRQKPTFFGLNEECITEKSSKAVYIILNTA